MLWNTPASCDFSRTATWLSVRLSPCESTVPEIVPVGSAASLLCAFALGMKLVSTRFRNRIVRKFVRSNRFSGFRVSYSISTCRPLLRFPLGGLCGLGEISRSDAGSHILQSFMDCVCGSPAPPCTLSSYQPSRTMQIYCLVNLLSVPFYTIHCRIHAKRLPPFLRAVNACKQTKKCCDAISAGFVFCLKRRHCAPT